MDISIPDNDIGAENLLELIYLGDTAGKRMHELAQSNSDHVLLAACPLGRIGATAACTNAKQGVEGFDVFAAVDGDNDTSTGNTPTYYQDRFCKSPIRNLITKGLPLAFLVSATVTGCLLLLLELVLIVNTSGPYDSVLYEY